MEESGVGWRELVKNLPRIITYLENSESLGLDKKEYNYDFIKDVYSGNVVPVNLQDSAATKEKILNAIIRFVNDIVNGKMPQFSFNGLKEIYKPRDVLEIIDRLMNSNDLYYDILQHETQSQWYINIKQVYKNLRDSIGSGLLSPAGKRIKGLEQALKTVRWMDGLLKQNEYTIVVNVPSASLLLYKFDKPLLESAVIVGKRNTRTPIFASALTDITIFPYWMVPKSIATKELLPEIKKDVTYLERNNFQVLNKNGQVADPKSINWTELSRDNFPYTIRQSTGCDNSLGLIKLNINDPFNVYLHDTPWKALFEAQNRFFSHGCIRVQKAKELSGYLLKGNRVAVDTLDETKSYIGKNPKVLSISNKVPVLILYNIAWFNAEGLVHFYPDIYSRF